MRTAAAGPATAPSIEQRMADLVRTIESYVDPGSWGAPGRAITVMGKGHLLVTHAPATHERLAAFLTELGAARGPTLTVEAMIFSLDPAALDALPAFAREILKSRVGRAALSEDEMRRFKADLAGAAPVSIVSAPRITVFSGQRAYVLVSTQRAYVAALAQVRGPDGGTTYEPSVDFVDTGIVLDVRAMASADRKYVTLTLRPQVAELVRIEQAAQKMPDGTT